MAQRGWRRRKLHDRAFMCVSPVDVPVFLSCDHQQSTASLVLVIERDGLDAVPAMLHSWYSGYCGEHWLIVGDMDV